MSIKIKKVVFLLLIFLTILTSYNCDQISNRMFRKKYDEGFSLRHPSDWHAKLINNGYIWISPIKTDNNQQFIVVYPFFLKKTNQSRFWLKKNLHKLTQFFPNTSIQKTKQIRNRPDEAAVKFRFERNNISYLGIALCSIFKKSGILYAMTAPEAIFNEQKDQMIDILGTFRFEEPIQKKQKSTRKIKIKYKSWQDPRERAFSLDVPRDWTVTGGTFRRASVDVVHVLRAISPDQNILIQFNDSNIPIFTTPNPTLAMGGFREGSWYSPGYGVRMMVKRYTPGYYFLNQYLHTNYQPYVKNFQLVSQKHRPDIVTDFNRIYKQFMSYGISFTLHAGDVAFRFEKNALPFVGYGLVLTQVVHTMGMGQWSVALMVIYTCPSSDAEIVREISNHMFKSVKVNPSWVSSQQQLTMNVSKIVTHTNQEIAKIINDSYWNRQKVLNNINRRFSNYILGVTDVMDPETGEKWKVEAGHNYYWRIDQTGQIRGTDAYMRPDINFSPLKEF